MKKIIVAVLALVMLAASYYGAKVYIGDKAYELFESGMEKLENQDYKSAIADFDRSISLADKGSWLFEKKLVDDLKSWNYAQRAWCYHALQKYETALKDYNKAEELGFDMPVFFTNRGSVKTELGMYVESAADFERSINAGSLDVSNYSKLGYSYFYQMMWDEAVKSFRKAIELYPDYEYAYHGLGEVYYYGLKDYEKAKEKFDKALELNNGLSNTLYFRGASYKELNNIEAAEADFRKVIELPVSDNAYDYFFRGLAYYELKDYKSAVEDFEKSIEINPKYFGVYYSLAESYKELNEYEKAAENYKTYLKITGNKFGNEAEIKEKLSEIGFLKEAL
jgi:tetratricopeptide (TPR) repeat protein